MCLIDAMCVCMYIPVRRYVLVCVLVYVRVCVRLFTGFRGLGRCRSPEHSSWSILRQASSQALCMHANTVLRVCWSTCKKGEFRLEYPVSCSIHILLGVSSGFHHVKPAGGWWSGYCMSREWGEGVGRVKGLAFRLINWNNIPTIEYREVAMQQTWVKVLVHLSVQESWSLSTCTWQVLGVCHSQICMANFHTVGLNRRGSRWDQSYWCRRSSSNCLGSAALAIYDQAAWPDTILTTHSHDVTLHRWPNAHVLYNTTLRRWHWKDFKHHVSGNSWQSLEKKNKFLTSRTNCSTRCHKES